MPVSMHLTHDKDDDYFLPNFCSSRAVFLLVVVAELFVLVLVLAWSGSGVFDWNRLALTSLFVQWIVLVTAGTICLSRPLLHRFTAPIIATVCLSICLTVTSLFTLLSMWVMEGLAPSSQVPAEQALFWQSQSGQLLRNNVIALIISTIVLRYFFLQKELLRQQQAELTSRIQSLHSRIQPHFLFNSMNTIASLIATRPEVAEQVVEDLADLFRASLDKATILIPVEDEIALARQYLNIESLRFGDRLNITWQIDPLPEDVSLPRLCLQPILENAIVHGIQPDPAQGELIIKLTCNNKSLILTVDNTVPAVTPYQEDRNLATKGNHLALKNIADRLQALYGETASLQTDTFKSDNQSQREWFQTRLTCPLNAGRSQ